MWYGRERSAAGTFNIIRLTVMVRTANIVMVRNFNIVVVRNVNIVVVRNVNIVMVRNVNVVMVRLDRTIGSSTT